MKIINFLILLVSIHFQVHSSDSYVSEINPFEWKERFSWGTNLNENDDVLFYNRCGYSFIWYKDGRIQKLDDAGCWFLVGRVLELDDAAWCKLGNSGMVIGYLRSSHAPIYWTQKNAGIQKLNIEKDIPDVEDIVLVDINGADQILGNYKTHGIARALLWQNGLAKDLAIDQATIQLGFDVASVDAIAINEQGTVLGSFKDSKDIYYFLWDGQNLDIIDMPLNIETIKIVNLNNNNQVLMSVWPKEGQQSCVIWSKKEGHIFLKAEKFIPKKMNDKEEILGYFENSRQWGVLKERGKFIPLPGIFGGLPWEGAKDINNHGVVLAEREFTESMSDTDHHVMRFFPN